MKKLRILQIGAVVLAVIAGVVLWGVHPTVAVTSGDVAPAWSAPSVMALKQISTVGGHQNEPGYLSNLDCSLLTYRLVSDTTMRSGCFTETAFGQIDADSDVVIFNGTDEGLQLLPYSAHQILAPWPKALDLVTLDTVNTGGSYISLYKNPLGVLHDERDLLGQLTAKQLTTAPELTLKNAAGQPLVVNAQSLSFSDNGSWMVAEVLGGGFQRINLATLEATAFAPTYSRQGSPGLDSSSVTISPDGHYVAIENTYASEFKVYDLSNCSNGICASYNYWPFISQQISSLRFISHVRFINDGLLSFDAASGSDSAGGSYELAPMASISSLIDYLGLGDSYSSGEGAFDYLDGTDSADNSCHLSVNSYPLLLTRDLFTSGGGHSVACSGAVMHDIGDKTDGYRGQVRGVADWTHLQKDQSALWASIMANYLPGYVAQQRFVSRYQPANITIGVGGNNIGFGDILQRCLIPKNTNKLGSDTCFATYEDRQELRSLILKTGPQLQRLYQQLEAESPVSNLYVIGYPQISIDNGVCPVNVLLSDGELEFVDELVDEINSSIASAATAAGAHYVDISQALAGHRLCEANGSNVAMNGLTAGTDGGPGNLLIFGGESYHPNALGHQLIEQAILKQTNNLRLGKTVPNPTLKTPSQNFVSQPKTGRTVNQLVHEPKLTTRQARPGQVITITTDSLNDGLLPGGTYTIHLDGGQGQIIGATMGDIPVTVTLPATIEPGGHTIDVTGTNQLGQPVDVFQTIEVAPPVSATIPDNPPASVNTNSDTTTPGINDSVSSSVQVTDAASVIQDASMPPPDDANSGLGFSVSTDSSSAQISVEATPVDHLVTEVLGAQTAAKLVHGSQKLILPKLRIINWVLWCIIGLTCLIGLRLLDGWLRKVQKRRLS